MDDDDLKVMIAATQSAYVAMARRLAVELDLDLLQLADDLDLLCETQDHSVWQHQHIKLAESLRAVDDRFQASSSSPL